MTGTWIGKTRSLGLWSHINKYVENFSNTNNIQQDEPWLTRWNELVTVHYIMKKKRDFEFIAYVITGHPEATVIECLRHLFTLIPFLDQHIEITAISDSGTIQYTYHDEVFTNDSPDDPIPSIDTNNRFALLTKDSETNDDTILDDILNTTQQATDVYNQALDSATSTLKKISNYTDNITDDNNSMLADYVTDLESANKSALEDYKTKLSSTTTAHDTNFQKINEDNFNTFRHNCDQYYNTKLHHFNKYIDQALHTLEQTVDKKVLDLSDLNNKILQLDHKLNNITTPHKSQICTPETSILHQSDLRLIVHQ